MLRIGDFSKLSRISIRMLRHYDEIGLLVPKSVDDMTGYRHYAEGQLALAERILVLKRMGFSLTVISEILEKYDDANAMEQFLRIRKTELMDNERVIGQQIQLIDSTIRWLRKEGNIMGYEVTLKTLPERYVASVRQVIPAYDQEGVLWKILMKETQGLHMQDGNPCYTLAVFHDREYKENNPDVEVQKSVIGTYKDTEHVKFKTVYPIEMASATYKGSYEQIGAVNEAVANWIRDNGYDLAGTSFSIYHISPHETKNPDELVTEVCYPVKRK